MTTTRIDEDLYAELEELVGDLECELLHAEFAGNLLRLTIDHPDGLTIAHCETVSRQASALLDVSDFGAGSYTLEVSSPGLDRVLYGPRDYARFTDHVVRVTWQPTGGERRTIVGTLTAYDEATGRLTVVEQDTDSEFSIAADRVSKARLVPQF